MATKKQQIAELLYDLPTGKLSTDTIRWVMSHLPDEDTKGDNSQRPTKFKHDEEELHDAVGLTEQGIFDLALKLQACFEPGQEQGKKSMVLEKFYPMLDEKEKAFMVATGIPEFQNFAGHYVPEKFGVEGYEKLHQTTLTEDERKKLTTVVELQKHLEKLKSIFGKHGK
jgi:hypothetical protein